MDRAERRRRTENIVTRRTKVMRWSGMLKWADFRYVGRCKTLHPFDCGRPKCGVCGLLKRRWSGETRQEKKAEMMYQESLLEMIDSGK